MGKINQYDSYPPEKTIIFCLSYLSVPITISIVEAFDKDFLIVTSNKGLIDFFCRIYPNNSIFYLEPLPLFSKNPFKFIFNLYSIYKYKKNINDIFKVYRDMKVFFFGVSYCDFECWLVKILSTSNNIHYKPSVSLQYLKPGYSIQIKFGKWIRKLVYSVDFEGLSSGKHIRYAVSHEFLRKINAKEFNLPINTESVCQKILKSLPEIAKSRILILCGGVVGTYVSDYEYKLKMDDVIKNLEKIYGHDALAIKSHPQFGDYCSNEKTLIQIPSDIPANLILSHFDLVIGYSTATLIEAANAKIKSISLLKMMTPINLATRDAYIDYLDENSNNPIFYPDNLEKLIAITQR